jgi:catechol 2,3-dioxygenase-like lactoylglutathione lyase family enzyme
MKLHSPFLLLLILPLLLSAQTETFKLTFNHQALPVKQLQKTGDFYIQILGFEEIEMTASQLPPKRWLKEPRRQTTTPHYKRRWSPQYHHQPHGIFYRKFG